jgi:hypothetical protein
MHTCCDTHAGAPVRACQYVRAAMLWNIHFNIIFFVAFTESFELLLRHTNLPPGLHFIGFRALRDAHARTC